MPGWKPDVGRRLDALIVRHVPDLRKAVKWNARFHGIEGQGWFPAFHVFTRFVKGTFFRGTSLRPVPSGGTRKDARWVDIRRGADGDGGETGGCHQDWGKGQAWRNTTSSPLREVESPFIRGMEG